ncbi:MULTISPECIES: hypothetical protein [unclassified Streptomyces]
MSHPTGDLDPSDQRGPSVHTTISAFTLAYRKEKPSAGRRTTTGR